MLKDPAFVTTHPAAYCSIAGTRGESREDTSPGVTRGANATRASPRFDARPESWAFLLPAHLRRRRLRHLACTRDAARQNTSLESTKKANVGIARRLFATTQKLLHPDCALAGHVRGPGPTSVRAVGQWTDSS